MVKQRASQFWRVVVIEDTLQADQVRRGAAEAPRDTS